MCRSKLRESVLPSFHWEVCNHQCVFHLHHNVPPARVIMNSNPSIIDRNIRVCTTPRFCKRPFVNGKVASPKSIVGDTTASNHFSRKTKETCVFNKICLYQASLHAQMAALCEGASIYIQTETLPARNEGHEL